MPSSRSFGLQRRPDERISVRAASPKCKRACWALDAAAVVRKPGGAGAIGPLAKLKILLPPLPLNTDTAAALASAEPGGGAPLPMLLVQHDRPYRGPDPRPPRSMNTLPPRPTRRRPTSTRGCFAAGSLEDNEAVRVIIQAEAMRHGPPAGYEPLSRASLVK